MKKQDKLFSLLKRNGWERAKTPEGVCLLFKTLNRDNTSAHYDGVEALGWVEALDIIYKDIYVRKEGEFYATYLEF